jgi:hypothetical protein
MASTAENSPQYPFVVIQLSEKCRVIECAADMQWSCKNLTREQEPRIGTVFRSAGRKQPSCAALVSGIRRYWPCPFAIQMACAGGWRPVRANSTAQIVHHTRHP